MRSVAPGRTASAVNPAPTGQLCTPKLARVRMQFPEDTLMIFQRP